MKRVWQLDQQNTNIDPGRALWRPLKALSNFDMLLVGDTSFGENYQEREAANGRGNVLESHGYDHGFELVDPLLMDSDLVVANLETPLTTLRSSPFESFRPYIHYSDPSTTPRHLVRHNIRAVTLANNHTHDFGEAGLIQTLSALTESNIIAVGAGLNRTHARRPLRAQVKLADTKSKSLRRFRISLFSGFWGGRLFQEKMKAYATPQRPGSARLSLRWLCARITKLRQARPDEFIIVVPHWRRDYRWRSERQAEAAKQLVSAGADLILGHGSHMLQEIERIGSSWVFHGIGNFIFNSPGRYAQHGAPPYSLIVRLSASYDHTQFFVYPIVTDNRATGYQPRLVSEDEFETVNSLLVDTTNAPDRFTREFERRNDRYGWHLALSLDTALVK